MDKLRQLNIHSPKIDLRNFRQPVESEANSSRANLIGAISLLISCSLLAGLTLYAFKCTRPFNNISDLPLVLRDSSPLRTQPTQPGGMTVSNQNKAIYTQLKKEDTPQELTIDYVSQKKVRQVLDKYFINKTPSDSDQAKQNIVKDTSVVAMDSNNPTHNHDTFSALQKNITDDVPAAKPVVRNRENSQFFKVKVAAIKSQQDALDEWDRLQKKFKFLKGKKHHISEKTLPNGKKIFYLSILDIYSDEGELVCTELKKHTQGCYITKNR